MMLRKLYRLLLLLYPREHRVEYGESMVQLARDRFRDEGGGVRTVLLWGQLVGDAAVSALSERKDFTMATFKSGWWRYAAGLFAPLMILFGFGNLFGDDGGPLYGKLLALAATLLAAGAIVAGLAIRGRRRALGSMLIGIGSVPAMGGIVLFWFPPALLVGVLAVAVVAKAFGDMSRHANTTIPPAA